jgi:hypothetical protein
MAPALDLHSVRALAIESEREIAVVTEHTESFRQTVFKQPTPQVCVFRFTPMPIAAAADVIDC